MPDWTVERWTAVLAIAVSVTVGLAQAWYWLSSRQAKEAERQKIKAEAELQVAKLREAAEDARIVIQATARHDALAEWQKLYGERERQLAAVQAQNDRQQAQINDLRREHEECEERHAALALKVEKVEKIANGTKEVTQ